MTHQVGDLYAAVVNTRDTHWNLVHDAANPWAVVLFGRSQGVIHRVVKRFRTYRGACISASKQRA